MSSVTDQANSTASILEQAAEAAMGGDPGLWIGPYIIAVWMDAMLMGLVITQVIQWRSQAKNDSLGLKTIVYSASFLGLCETGFIFAMATHLFVYNFGVWVNFASITWLIYVPLINNFVVTPVQLFYGHRAWRLHNKSVFILIPLTLLGCLQFVMSVVIRVKAHDAGDLAQVAHTFRRYIYVWTASSLAIDLSIVILIGWGLWKVRTGWTHTDAIVQRVFILTVETAFVPMMVTLGFLVYFVISPNSTVAIFLEMILPKSYLVGLMVTLLSREGLVNEITQAENAYRPRSVMGQKTAVVVPSAIFDTKPWSTESGDRLPDVEEVDKEIDGVSAYSGGAGHQNDYQPSISKERLNRLDNQV